MSAEHVLHGRFSLHHYLMKKVGCPCSGKEATEAVTDGELSPVSI